MYFLQDAATGEKLEGFYYREELLGLRGQDGRDAAGPADGGDDDAPPAGADNDSE